MAEKKKNNTYSKKHILEHKKAKKLMLVLPFIQYYLSK